MRNHWTTASPMTLLDARSGLRLHIRHRWTGAAEFLSSAIDLSAVLSLWS